MNLFRNILSATVLMLVGVAVLGQAEVSAWSERVVAPTGDVRVNLDEKPKGSVYVYAPSGEAIITGKVDGDLYCAGESVSINAEVTGSINCAAMTKILLKGEVEGAARLASQEVNIEGSVAGDASVFGSRLNVAESASIEGDLNGSVSKVNIDGPVGAILGTMGETNINSQVGSMDIVARSISLGSSARIEGDVNYQVSGSGEIKINESKVDGEVNVIKAESKDSSPVDAYLTRLAITIAVILSLAVATLMPFSRLYRRVASITVGKLPLVLLVGFLTLFAVPTSLLFIALTIAGVPLALSLLMVWVVLLLASIGYTVFKIGDTLASVQARMNSVWSYVAAAALLGVAISLPLVGVTVILMSLIYGSGSLLFAIFSYQFGKDKNTKQDKKPKDSLKSTTIKK